MELTLSFGGIQIGNIKSDCCDAMSATVHTAKPKSHQGPPFLVGHLWLHQTPLALVYLGVGYQYGTTRMLRLVTS